MSPTRRGLNRNHGRAQWCPQRSGLMELRLIRWRKKVRLAGTILAAKLKQEDLCSQDVSADFSSLSLSSGSRATSHQHKQDRAFSTKSQKTVRILFSFYHLNGVHSCNFAPFSPAHCRNRLRSASCVGDSTVLCSKRRHRRASPDRGNRDRSRRC
jgi:hypothetical protein